VEKSQYRNATQLSEPFSRHLSQYALAASATAVGLLALASPAESKIVYTPADTKVTGFLMLNLNHQGKADFSFSSAAYTTNCGNSFVALLRVAPYGPNRSQNRIVGKNGSAYALTAGRKIGAAGPFSNNADLMGRVTGTQNGGHRFEGQWVNSGKGVKDRYLGLKFSIKGQTHFGWARLNIAANDTGTLTGYAYETVANKAIIAGKTKGPEVITLEPGSLGRLAQGAAGRLGK